MALAFGSFVTAAVLAVSGVIIESSLDCPAAARVSEELARIVPNAAATEVNDRAVVSSESGVLLVLLTAPDGAILGERRIAAEGTCDEQARALAVILGTWLTDIHPEYRSALPVPPAVAEEPSQLPAEEPLVAPAPAVPPSPPSQAPTLPPVSVAPSPAKSEGAAVRRWSGALAVGAGVSEAGTVLAGAASVSYAPERTGFGASVFALLTLPAERSLGSGTVSAFRWPLGAGPLVRVQAGSAFLDVTAGPTLAWLRVAGDDFNENRSANDVAIGAFGRARVGFCWSRFRPFVEAGLLGWFGASTVVARAPDTELELPTFESFLLAGVAFEP
jgi:hypothetical protein